MGVPTAKCINKVRKGLLIITPFLLRIKVKERVLDIEEIFRDSTWLGELLGSDFKIESTNMNWVQFFL